MTFDPIACPRCSNMLAGWLYNAPETIQCPYCQAKLDITVFPALFRETDGGSIGESLVVADDAACFNHPDKIAVQACETCGRFLCALCDVELDGQHSCPSCLERGFKKGGVKNLATDAYRYDLAALQMAIVPLLACAIPTCLTAPMTLIIVALYRKKDCGAYANAKTYFNAATSIALLEIFSWMLFLIIKFGDLA